jgi:hypothetical protein
VSPPEGFSRTLSQSRALRMVQDRVPSNTDDSIAFAVGVLHGDMESALESGSASSARQALARILEIISNARGSQLAAAAYRQFDAATQQAHSAKFPSSPILLASNLRRSVASIGFSGSRFALGYWASSCRLASARRDAAFFNGLEARRGWASVRSEGLPEAALSALNTAQRLLAEAPKTDAHWRRLEEAFRQFILLL